MINTGKYIKQQPDRVVQRMISIFGKKKCACGCACADGGNSGGEATGGTGTDDHRMIVGSGEPTPYTAADLGDYYRDQTTGHIYECIEVKSENIKQTINMVQVSEALDAPDASYFTPDAWPDHAYGVLITSDNEVRALYEKQNGELSQELNYFITTDQNELPSAFDSGHKIVVLIANNTFYVCTRTTEKGKNTVYTWLDLTLENITNEEINNIVNSLNN